MGAAQWRGNGAVPLPYNWQTLSVLPAFIYQVVCESKRYAAYIHSNVNGGQADTEEGKGFMNGSIAELSSMVPLSFFSQLSRLPLCDKFRNVVPMCKNSRCCGLTSTVDVAITARASYCRMSAGNSEISAIRYLQCRTSCVDSRHFNRKKKTIANAISIWHWWSSISFRGYK